MMIALVFDTETTSLIENRIVRLDKQPDIIEFYGVVVNLETNEQHQELHLLIKPRNPLEAKAFKEGDKTTTEITGITNEMLEGAPPFAAVADQIFAFIESAPLIIAHNLSFDKDALEIEAQRLGRTIDWPPGLCSVEQSLHLKSKRLTLTKLYEELFDKKFEGAHRAKNDVQALVRCCQELLKRGAL